MNILRNNPIEYSMLDKVNYYGDFITLPLILLADSYYLTEYNKLDISLVFSFIIGVLVYGSIVEYAFHRFIYHGTIKKIKKLHLLHHKFPQSYISAPPYITVSLLFVVHLVFMHLLGVKDGLAFAGGITFGYLWYITIHHLIHHLTYDDSKIFNYFKLEHNIHHQHAKLNYCVSQPFWNTFYRALAYRK